MKKKESKFKVKHRGYDVKAVDEYLLSEKDKYEGVIAAQRDRINALSKECSSLTLEVERLKGREDQIKGAYVVAMQNADKLTADIKARYFAERDRLKLFLAKWMTSYENLKDRYHFDKDALNMESVAVSCKVEIEKFLTQDFSLLKGDGMNEMENYFLSEAKRLSDKPQDQKTDVKPSYGANELKKKLAEAVDKKSEEGKNKNAPAAFSLEDALNPTESLEEICKSLGIVGK